MKETLSIKIPTELKKWLYEWSKVNKIKVSTILILLIEYLKEKEPIITDDDNNREQL